MTDIRAALEKTLDRWEGQADDYFKRGRIQRAMWLRKAIEEVRATLPAASPEPERCAWEYRDAYKRDVKCEAERQSGEHEHDEKCQPDHHPDQWCHPFQPAPAAPSAEALLDHIARLIPRACCPVCTEAVVIRLPDDWQAQVMAGNALDIVGCGNPWHYATEGMDRPDRATPPVTVDALATALHAIGLDHFWVVIRDGVKEPTEVQRKFAAAILTALERQA